MTYSKKDIEDMVAEVMDDIDSNELMDPDTDDHASIAFLNAIIKDCKSRVNDLKSDVEDSEEEDFNTN